MSGKHSVITISPSGLLFVGPRPVPVLPSVVVLPGNKNNLLFEYIRVYQLELHLPASGKAAELSL